MDETDASQSEGAHAVSATKIDRKHELLSQAIEENWLRLRKTAYSYIDSQVKRGNLPRPEDMKKLATDIATEAVLQVLDTADRYDPNQEPLRWIFGYIRNAVLSYGRDEKRAYERQQDPTKYSEVSVWDLRPRDVAKEDWNEDEIFGQLIEEQREPRSSRIDNETLHRYLRQLGEEDRHILQRRYFDGVMVKDMAAEEGISENYMSVKLSRARGRLRDLIEEGEK